MKHSTSTSVFTRDKVKSEYKHIKDPLFLVVIGMERWERVSEGVWRYKIGEKRMCALCQLKSCQGTGTYKLQARDNRQLSL